MISRRNSIAIGIAALYGVSVGCDTKKRSDTLLVLVDNSGDYTRAPLFAPAMEAIKRSVTTIAQTLPIGGSVFLYTLADSVNFTPSCVAAWQKDTDEQGKYLVALSARRRHDDTLNAMVARKIDAVRATPIESETRLIETVYSVLKTLNQRENGSGNPAEVVIASDMEPYTLGTHPLSAARIVESHESLKNKVADITKQYPKITGIPFDVSIVYTPSIDMARLSPVHQDRLEKFWTSFFQHIGASHVAWTSPTPTQT